MKYVIAWPIWYKPDIMPLIIESIVAFVDPAEARIMFFFDGNDPESRESFYQHRAALESYSYAVDGSDDEIMENGCHNRIIDWFMEKTDARAVVIHQDDTRPTAPGMLKDLTRLLDAFGNNVGYIGCRDGYDLRYGNFISSPWSASDNARVKLPVGEYQIRLSINPGPLIYARSTVEKIGKLDPAYHAWYWWDDYALRAVSAGLSNVILSTDCIHQKYGRTKTSTVYQDPKGWVATDLKLLNDRWGPRYNGNVI